MTLLLVRINCPSEAIATSLAEAAVAARLSPCANIEGPIRSIYTWQGQIEREEEWLLWLKVTETVWDRLEALILDQHPYDTPAILAIPCVRANKGYADWLIENTDD